MIRVDPHREDSEPDFPRVDRHPVDVHPMAQELGHRDGEIPEIGRRVEPDEIGSQHAFEKLLLPRANAERFGIRPGDMPE